MKNEPRTYRKKPVEVQAILWDGTTRCASAIYKAWGRGFTHNVEKGELYISTLEGVMTARKGDYIIRGVNDEVYPCKPDVFAKTYELVPWELDREGDS